MRFKFEDPCRYVKLSSPPDIRVLKWVKFIKKCIGISSIFLGKKNVSDMIVRSNVVHTVQLS